MDNCNYFILEYGSLPNECVIDNFMDDDNDFKLSIGQRYGQDDPDEYWGTMDKGFPENTLLFDVVSNTDSNLIVSEKFKNFLQEHAHGDIEFLPLVILDHNSKPVPKTYWIVNSMELVECIDMGSSEYLENRINGRIRTAHKLVLDESKISPDNNFFRIKPLPWRYIRWIEVEDFSGI